MGCEGSEGSEAGSERSEGSEAGSEKIKVKDTLE
jgi:hypothetical protein